MKLLKTYRRLDAGLKRRPVLKRCLRLLMAFIVVALLAPVLANDKPLACHYKNTWLFPAFSWKNHGMAGDSLFRYNIGQDWKSLKADFILFPPCAYSPNTIDADNAPRVGPFAAQLRSYGQGRFSPLPAKFRHWLGTTQNGQDVLSILIHGTGIAIGIGFGSMLLAALLGISLGAFAGYFTNEGLRIGPLQLLALLLGLFLTYFYCFVIRGDKLAAAFEEGGIWLMLRLLFLCYVALKTVGGMVWIAGYFERRLRINFRMRFPADTLVSRCIEILNSLPSLLLIIVLSVIAKPSYSLLMLIIGFLSWTHIARLVRAECLKARNLDYVLAARALGMRHGRIIFRHILPNIFPLILVQIVFGLGSAVLAEASLSFIGIGIPAGSSSWGSLLNEARDHFSSWWLVLFPGLSLLALLLLYNRIAAELSKQEPRKPPVSGQ